jgi:hypothetical protein
MRNFCIVAQMDQLFEIDARARQEALTPEDRLALPLEKSKPQEWKRGQQIMRPNSPSEPSTETRKPPERVNQNCVKTESHNNSLPPIVALTSRRVSNAPNPLAEGQTVNENKYNLTNENYSSNRKTSSDF